MNPDHDFASGRFVRFASSEAFMQSLRARGHERLTYEITVDGVAVIRGEAERPKEWA